MFTSTHLIWFKPLRSFSSKIIFFRFFTLGQIFWTFRARSLVITFCEKVCTGNLLTTNRLSAFRNLCKTLSSFQGYVNHLSFIQLEWYLNLFRTVDVSSLFVMFRNWYPQTHTRVHSSYFRCMYFIINYINQLPLFNTAFCFLWITDSFFLGDFCWSLKKFSF